jgi:NAD(P)H-nitrite reductase large subunit
LMTQEITSHPYDTLILAPGAGAIMPYIPGIPARNIFTVKTVPDSDAIKTFLAGQPSQQALVIGGGFFGLETAEALMGLGLTVTIIEKPLKFCLLSIRTWPPLWRITCKKRE